MSDMTIAELAAKAAAEIERRGWVRGDLTYYGDLPPEIRYDDYKPDDWELDPEHGVLVGKPGTDWEDWELTDLSTSPAALDQCKVCALGGMRAAFDGSPDLGMARDGNGYDMFVRAVADAIEPGWETRPATVFVGTAYERMTKKYANAMAVVYTWNDELPEATGKDTVVALLTELANSQ